MSEWKQITQDCGNHIVVVGRCGEEDDWDIKSLIPTTIGSVGQVLGYLNGLEADTSTFRELVTSLTSAPPKWGVPMIIKSLSEMEDKFIHLNEQEWAVRVNWLEGFLGSWRARAKAALGD